MDISSYQFSPRHCVTKVLPNFLVWKFCGSASFHRVSGGLPETLRKLCVSKIFDTKKFGEVLVFYAVMHVFINIPAKTL